ncbi:MAG TPA: triose-phosphate isomerase [Elusimicrobiota bacterium]|jgi:triosephosphate isomerase|nr:triose-phosphate isomerase [Elusimicrobiota bacterium]
MNPTRRPLIAGNWKMNLDLKASAELAKAVAAEARGHDGVEVMVAPPFTALTTVGAALAGSNVRLSAQDVYWEASGAYTGEVSAGQLKDAGCKMVIIGHSERRRHFGDTDDCINRKLKATLGAGLVPVVCVGETLDERESQKTWRVLETQIAGGLKGFAPADLSSLVIAYEPVWAIGTGKTATPAQAQEAHLFIRKQLAKLHGDAFAQSVRILYGGSVTPENIDAIMAEPDVDGALVGGASLKPASFVRIVKYEVAVRG